MFTTYLFPDCLFNKKEGWAYKQPWKMSATGYTNKPIRDGNIQQFLWHWPYHNRQNSILLWLFDGQNRCPGSTSAYGFILPMTNTQINNLQKIMSYILQLSSPVMLTTPRPCQVGENSQAQQFQQISCRQLTFQFGIRYPRYLKAGQLVSQRAG